VRDGDGKEVSLAQYAGKVTVVVNVASQCGYTEANYKGLTKLYKKFHDQGLEARACALSSVVYTCDV
jgi:glutathione peroxidase